MIVKDILHSEQSEWQRDHEDVIRRITALNDMEPSATKNPPGIDEFPKKSASVLPQVSQRCGPLFRHGVPVDVNAINFLVSLRISLALRTQHRHLVVGATETGGLLPHPTIKGNRQVFDDNEDFSFHDS